LEVVANIVRTLAPGTIEIIRDVIIGITENLVKRDIESKRLRS
jgi:hypothetical protein